MEKIERGSAAYVTTGLTILCVLLSYPKYPFRVAMAMSYGVGVFPERMRFALEFRSGGGCVCPADVEAKFASIPFFRKSGGGGGGGGSSTCRFPTLSHAATDSFASNNRVWRGGNSGGAGGAAGGAAAGADEDGFQVWSRRRAGGRILPHATNSFSAARRAETPAEEASSAPTTVTATATTTATTTTTTTTATAPVSADEPVKFSSAAVKSGVDMEERILARVKGKVNKIGFSTYDATKAFMQQILDSDEIGFLDELMKFIFQKAATESTFCPLYARLLHELADEFGHLRVVMRKLFTDYTVIFTEMNTSPDVGTSDYKAFVEAQERKKFRRGYSQFVAELVKYGEADGEAFAGLLRQILTVLEESYTVSERTLTCEEYVDCLANMLTAAGPTLSEAVSADIKARLDVLVKKSRAESSGVTNKCRFAMMDILDLGKKGWKK